MKILITSSYCKGATINRVKGFINVLSEDNDVEVILPKPDFDIKLLGDKTKLHFVELKPIKSKNFLLRYLWEFKYGLKCQKIQKKVNADLEIITVPFISLIITALLTKRKSLKVLDIRDLVWEYLVGGTITRFLKLIIKKVHTYFINRYDFITVTNDFEYNWVKQNTRFNDSIIINNGILQEQYNKLKELNVKNATKPYKILYVGNVGIAQNLTTFIQACQDLKDIEFLIIGDGNDYENVKDYITRNKVKNVYLKGRVLPNQVFEYYAHADILYAKLDPNFATAVPSKLYEYLATNKPIIYSGKGAALNLLKKFNKVYICKDEISSIKKTIQEIIGEGVYLSETNQKKIEDNYIRENVIKENFSVIYEKIDSFRS